MPPGIIRTKKLSAKKENSKIKGNMCFSSVIKEVKEKYINFTFIKQNIAYIFFALCILFGFASGCVLSATQDQTLNNSLNLLFCSNHTTRLTQEISTTFISSVTAYFIPVLSSVLFGLSFAGVIFIPFILIIKGLGIGISASYICLTYSFKGCLFACIVVFPGLFLSIIALFITSKEAMNFSSALLFTQFRPHPVPRVKTFFIKISRVFIILVLASLLDIFLSRCFSGIFIF